MNNMQNTNNNMNYSQQPVARYCKFCGSPIPVGAVVCGNCGQRIQDVQQNYVQPAPPIIISNNNVTYSGNAKNKWVAFFLCLFFGIFGVHKFYERKILLGIVYFFTAGLFFIGVFVDLIRILFKPNPYYV